MKAVKFNDEYRVLVDEMGLPVPHSVVAGLIVQGLAHLNHSALEIEAIASRLIRENAPNMASQINMEYFTDGFDSHSGIAGMKLLHEVGNGSEEH